MQTTRKLPPVPLPPEQLMGPSAEYMASCHEKMALHDQLVECLAEWELDLAAEYGTERAMRVIRLGKGAKASRAALEAERLRNEELRWQNGGRLPFGH